MKKLYSFLIFMLLLVTAQKSFTQNLLNTNTWAIGSGGTQGFNQVGPTVENSREYGLNHLGENTILWKATPGVNGQSSGGWNTNYHNIDNTKTYRFTVWLKKINSNDGYSYLGTGSSNGGILNLNGTVNTNPYFWAGDLPQLNKWYLVVGYVHGSTYNSSISYGGVYDPITGAKVVNAVDFKFAEIAQNTRHRSFLYYDSNTSDRQFFFDPRIEKVDGNEPSIQDLLGPPGDVDANLYDLSGWTVGTGHITDFNYYSSYNSRELGDNHVGKEVVLWKSMGQPNSTGLISGGIYGHNKSIDKNKTYRLSIWIKKENSHDGRTYFGCFSASGGIHHTLNLNGTANLNPYFWYGDLPKLNRWYLLVSYVHPNSYNGSSLGKIYDGTTGEPIITTTDKKFDTEAINLMLRAFLYRTPNVNDKHYLYHPRIDEISGNEPTITELLQINEDSKLILSYDVAGNQKQRFYCEEDGFCSPPAPTSTAIENFEEDLIAELSLPDPGEDEIIEETEEENLDTNYTMYPNPTSSLVSIRLSGVDYNLTRSVNVYNTNGSLVQKINITSPTNQIDLDLSNKPSGVYFIHMHFTNGNVVTEKIIKK